MIQRLHAPIGVRGMVIASLQNAASLITWRRKREKNLFDYQEERGTILRQRGELFIGD
jgi:hypothetical protein